MERWDEKCRPRGGVSTSILQRTYAITTMLGKSLLRGGDSLVFGFLLDLGHRLIPIVHFHSECSRLLSMSVNFPRSKISPPKFRPKTPDGKPVENFPPKIFGPWGSFTLHFCLCSAMYGPLRPSKKHQRNRKC